MTALTGLVESRSASQSPVPLVISIPHCGETVPPEADWLRATPRELLLMDIDRFVDQLYQPGMTALGLPWVLTRVHRYATDLNRYPEDVDQDSVLGASADSGKFSKGFHWVKTTESHPLISKPISRELHEDLSRRYHDPFHREFQKLRTELRSRFPGRPLYHLDCHSMPSTGTDAHQDEGRSRPDVVISDLNGKSASPAFKNLVMSTFEETGWEVTYNWPYQGGRITQRYGNPSQGEHTIQIELKRKLYMSEESREKLASFQRVQEILKSCLSRITKGLELNP